MKHKFRLMMLVLGILATAPTMKALDDAMDSEGYPVLYILGEDTGWGPRDDHKFTRSGDEYSITLSSLNGQFKIGSDLWHYNLGGDATITKPVNLTLVNDGANLRASSLSNVSIRFTLASKEAPMADTRVQFGINGEWADDNGPEPGEDLSGTLPVIYINAYKVDDNGDFLLDDNGNKMLENEVIDINLGHKNYFEAEYWLDVNGCKWLEELGAKSVGSAEEPLPTQIKARGNWTRTGFAKKPFKLKLGKKQNLLGLTPDKSKHYALLAHADDNYGFLRNFTGFNLGERIGLPFVCGMQPVEVVINGNYRGLYFLTESIRVGDGRINITELDDNVSDGQLISGGYLVELDNYDEDNQIRLSEKSCAYGHNLDVLRITWDTPEEYSELQQRFITEQFTAMNDLIGSNSDATWSYIDLDDAVRYYIAREIVSDVEAYHGSTYMYRDFGDGQKWHFSPIWDCGNAFNGDTHSYFYDCDPFGNTWIPSLRENARFNAKLTETWCWFMSNCYDGIVDDMTEFVERIKPAVQADYARWKDSPCPSGGSYPADNRDMDSRLNAAVSHLNDKTNWLRQQWGDYSVMTPEPERDSTPAAALPEYAATGVEDVAVDAAEYVPAVYFDLMGRRVANPTRGQLLIRQQGTTTAKVVF